MSDTQPPRSPLEPDAETMRAMLAMVSERIVRYVEDLPNMPASESRGGPELARALREPMPRQASQLETLLDTIFDKAAAVGNLSAGPGDLSYVPGGGLFFAALADLIADVMNRYIPSWQSAPGLVQLETNALRWICEMLGFPASAGGVFTSGGSLANLGAVVAAREAHLGEHATSGIIYMSEQTHHSVSKAARVAGFAQSQLRRIACDERWRIRIDALSAAVKRDRAQGLRPFLVVGNVGTTNTGAIDDIAALAALAERERLWLHLDAAYGGFFALTQRGRAAMRGMERADSVTVDPHKGMFLPFGTGCLTVRDLGALRRAHTSGAAYLPAGQTCPDFIDYSELSPELSRDFRGLRVWLSLRLVGVPAFAQALDEKLDLARFAAAALQRIPEVQLVAPPELSLLAFRHAPPGLSAEALDRHNRELLAEINARKRILLSGTVVDGRFLIRFCVLNFRTHRDRIEAGLQDIRSAIDALRNRQELQESA